MAGKAGHRAPCVRSRWSAPFSGLFLGFRAMSANCAGQSAVEWCVRAAYSAGVCLLDRVDIHDSVNSDNWRNVMAKAGAVLDVAVVQLVWVREFDCGTGGFDEQRP
jgi:hypothetical protein